MKIETNNLTTKTQFDDFSSYLKKPYKSYYVDVRVRDKPMTKEEADRVGRHLERFFSLEEMLSDKIKHLPIYCKVCGEKLSMSSSGPDTPSWACSGYEDNDDDGPLKWKKGRTCADKHYGDSRRYMGFDTFKYYEDLERQYREILDYLNGKVKIAA